MDTRFIPSPRSSKKNRSGGGQTSAPNQKNGAVKYLPHIERRIDLKKEKFQMRISKDTRADLDRVAKHYNLSASATVDMLIAKETRLIDKQRKEDEGK